MIKNILKLLLFLLVFLLPVIVFIIYLPKQGKLSVYCIHQTKTTKNVKKVKQAWNQIQAHTGTKNSDALKLDLKKKETSNISSSSDVAYTQNNKNDNQKTFFDSISSNTKQKLGDNSFEAIIVDNVLNKDECEQIINLCKNRFRSSHEYLTNKNDKTFRTSQTSSFFSHPLMKSIDEKISKVLNLDDAYSETTQVQYYQKGQQFKPHTDYFTPNTKEFQRFAGKRGQRTYTVIAYLSDVDEGGDTIFTKMDINVKPKLGRLLVWNNQTDKGHVNPQSMHWGSPVVRGHKYILTKWYREKKS